MRLHPTKKTKIIATIGPASESEKIVRELITAGVNIFRFNLKHNDHAWHSEKIDLVRKVAKELNTSVGVLIDLQGPEIRIGKFNGDEINLNRKEQVAFANEEIEGIKTITLNPKSVVKKLKIGQEILIDDGKFVFKVIKEEPGYVIASTIEGGLLRSSKGASFPNLDLKIPPLMPKDIEDIRLGIKKNADFVALSFIRDGKDIKILKESLNKLKSQMQVIAKVEKWEAVEHLDEIIKETDAVMVARGDLGVEVPMEMVPTIQKRLVETCRQQDTPVIIATQMLKSMELSPIPTRAEITDVANAVFEGADAVMLSEESAMGKYPTRTVETMAKILRYNESTNEFQTEVHVHEQAEIKVDEALTYAAHVLYDFYSVSNKDLKGFIVFSESGKTVREIAKYRSNIPTYAFTQNKTVRNQLNLSWGVVPFYLKFDDSVAKTIDQIKLILIRDKFAKKGDKFIAVSGYILGQSGNTDTIRLITI